MGQRGLEVKEVVRVHGATSLARCSQLTFKDELKIGQMEGVSIMMPSV